MASTTTPTRWPPPGRRTISAVVDSLRIGAGVRMRGSVRMLANFLVVRSSLPQMYPRVVSGVVIVLTVNGASGPGPTPDGDPSRSSWAIAAPMVTVVLTWYIPLTPRGGRHGQ